MEPTDDPGTPFTEIRVDDLAAPILTDSERATLDYADGLDVRLDAETLLEAASDRTGLSDFGDASFRPHLGAHIAAIEADDGLTGLGRLIQRRRLIRILSSRALLEDLLSRHPEIHDIELDPPVIVVGLPRSGTTHLVNVLASDRRFRSLPFWESQEPFPNRGEGPDRDGLDPRFVRCRADYEVEMAMAPLTRAMHHRHPTAIEEEVELLDVAFGSYSLEWHARVPSWRDHYLGADQTPAYSYLAVMLRALTFLRGPRRWVLKSPQHLEQLGPLTATFPDATVVFTHRDPVAVIASAVTMLAYGDRLRQRSVRAPELAEYWVDRIERLLRSFERDRDLIEPSRTVDIVFDDFMADESATIERVYAAAGLALDDASRRSVEGYLAGNPRGRNGRMVYDLAGDFGVDIDELSRRFAFYTERVGLGPSAPI